ncbi:RHS repeat-associated core domain-containing protein [Belliella kenyensis]|uniref:RHS repeat-associated core domain-containing protein n=1 Tax=Belliella kenyensis TaxID=1472724 RepID=A0ABV8ENK2_9BACT|nr:RHS repeat-associated core domain-containing protein [Belliella kenyensis]MDN3601964.1 RHS repeat-associated core domain-containing protein [Belliella kenyensis]
MNKYLYNGKEHLTDLNLNLYDFGARYFDPVIGRWTSPDPMASERSWVSPYNYVQNNPLNRIDPDGRFDWVINKDNEVYWDENATSQATTKTGETYLGKMGFGVDEQTGNTKVYNPDGVINEGVRSLPEVTVSSGNPVTDAIYKGNRDFALGALDLTSQTFGKVGASATVAGLVIAPFAPPVGAGLITIGETFSAVSGTASAALNLNRGNIGAAFTDAALLSIGSFGSAGIKSLEGGAVNSTGQYLLRGTQNTSLEITNHLIVPAFQNRKK